MAKQKLYDYIIVHTEIRPSQADIRTQCQTNQWLFVDIIEQKDNTFKVYFKKEVNG